MDAGVLVAASLPGGWPAIAVAGWPDKTPEWIARGTGGGLAILPLVVWWLLVLAWTLVVDWANRDAARLKLLPAYWSGVVALPFAAAALVAWWIPSALGGQALMLVAGAAGALVYVFHRNGKVPVTERVLTPHHARRLAAKLLEGFGVEIDVGEQVEESLPKVELVAIGGRDEAENTARQEAAVAAPGFEEARKALVDAVVDRATTVVMEPGADGFSVRHEVDGVWQKPKVRKPGDGRKQKDAWVDAPPRTVAAGTEAVAALRALAGIAPKGGQRSGPFTAMVDGKPRSCRLELQPTGAGEIAIVKIEPPAVVFKNLGDVGMPEPLRNRLKELLAVERGLIVVSSPPGSGRTATFDVVLLATDRLLRDFVSIEDAAAPPREIQNIKPFRFDARTGVTPAQVLADALREYPRAIVTRDLDPKKPADRELLAELVRLAANDMLVILSLRASEAIDAVGQLLAGGIEPKALARVLVGSLSQRLVRKLCPKCREEVETPAEVLNRLRKPIEELPKIRRAPANGCRLCRGTGHLARTAVFELASGGGLRQGLAAGVDLKKLRDIAVEQGMVRMRDAGLTLVAEGVVGYEELQRVFATGTGEKPKPAGKPS